MIGKVAASGALALLLGGAALAHGPSGPGMGFGGMGDGHDWSFFWGRPGPMEWPEGWGFGMGGMMGPGFGGMMGPGMMGPGFGGMGFGPGLGFAAGPLDADGDGAVSADEASARAEIAFARLDPDGDGLVPEAEFLGAAAMGAFARHPMAERRAARFAALDADGDKVLTRDEFFAAAEADYGAADTDGDGTVTVWEYRSAHGPL